RRRNPLQTPRSWNVRQSRRPRGAARAPPREVLRRRRRPHDRRGAANRDPDRRYRGTTGTRGGVVADDLEVHGSGAHDIEFTDVSIRYGRNPDDEAIRDLSVHFEGGVIHGLLGRNGSGKTSLLSAVAGFRPSNSGTVTVGGLPPFENPARTEHVCMI